jgi:GNAT superfamily N-acetyltransferase
MRVGIVDGIETRELRRAVLRPNLTPADPLPGDELPPDAAVHIAAQDEDGTVIGACFVYAEPCAWLPDSDGAWHLRAMATARELRNAGVGGAVLQAAVEYVRLRGAPLVWLHAREQAGRFYARHGFVIVGDVFTDEQHVIPHLRMWRELREPVAAPTSSEG